MISTEFLFVHASLVGRFDQYRAGGWDVDGLFQLFHGKAISKSLDEEIVFPNEGPFVDFT